jgi:hypothetical protein
LYIFLMADGQLDPGRHPVLQPAHNIILMPPAGARQLAHASGSVVDIQKAFAAEQVR